MSDPSLPSTYVCAEACANARCAHARRHVFGDERGIVTNVMACLHAYRREWRLTCRQARLQACLQARLQAHL